MDRVSMNDGLDGRETVAFGLATGEVAVFVLALLAAYATLRSGLPAVLAWPAAIVVAGGGAGVAWGRLQGRPLLEWAVLAARFAARTRHDHAARLRQRLPGSWPGRHAGQAGAIVVSLPLRGPGPAPSRPALPQDARPDHRAAVVRSHVVAFFSLAGGSGRTTLAVEAAVLLAARGRAAAAAGGRALRVALVDLAVRHPTASLRLGIPLLPGAATGGHASGLAVHPSIAEAERAGAHVVVVDIDCDLGDGCRAALERSDLVLVTVTPTAAGVLDAYRSTAALRALGLRERISYVGNRWHDDADIAEAMADLAGTVAVTIPEDVAFVTAEADHRAVCLQGRGPAAAALEALADAIEVGAAGPPATAWAGRHAG